MEQTGGVLTCGPDGGGFKYFLDGVANAFRALGVRVDAWPGDDKAHDFIMERRPRLYLGCSEGWRRPLSDLLRYKFNVAVLYHVNPVGPLKAGKLEETAENRDYVEGLLPDGVFFYAEEKAGQDFYGNWYYKNGFRLWPMPTAADVTIYGRGEKRDEYECDFAWVGGRWPYKAAALDMYLEPLRDKGSCRFYGWNDPWRSGPILDENCRHLFSSAKICPAVCEPHSAELPIDLPERVFKVVSAGGFAVHSPTPCLKALGLADVIPVARDAADWFKIIDRFLRDDKLREAARRRQYQAVMAGHTYFHRIAPWILQYFPEKEMALDAKLKELAHE